MDVREIVLYVCAAAVVVAGTHALIAVMAVGPENDLRLTPDRVLRAGAAAWRRLPWLTALVLTATIVFSLLQWPFPALLADLQRDPNATGQWWRLFGAGLVQSSGLVQTIVNLPALALVGAVAEVVLGRSRWLVVYVGSGVAANAVSVAGWSPYGAGSSVFICGLVGAVSTLYLLSGPVAFSSWSVRRRLTLLVPLAGIVLCALTNNHGIGLLTGCAFGLVLTALPRPIGMRLPAAPELAAA